MTYEIEYSNQANKFLKGLGKDITKRIINKIEEIRENPFRYLEHFEGKDVFKFRIGDYRALIDIDHENKILVVRVLDKRGRIYKR